METKRERRLCEKVRRLQSELAQAYTRNAAMKAELAARPVVEKIVHVYPDPRDARYDTFMRCVEAVMPPPMIFGETPALPEVPHDR